MFVIFRLSQGLSGYLPEDISPMAVVATQAEAEQIVSALGDYTSAMDGDDDDGPDPNEDETWTYHEVELVTDPAAFVRANQS